MNLTYSTAGRKSLKRFVPSLEAFTLGRFAWSGFTLNSSICDHRTSSQMCTVHDRFNILCFYLFGPIMRTRVKDTWVYCMCVA